MTKTPKQMLKSELIEALALMTAACGAAEEMAKLGVKQHAATKAELAAVRKRVRQALR